jgi:hypothetical protein
MTPRRPRNEGKRRFTFWLPDETADELERLQLKLGRGSVAEVVRDAIEVYRSLLDARKEGVRLYFRRPDGVDEGPVWLLPGPPPL